MKKIVTLLAVAALAAPAVGASCEETQRDLEKSQEDLENISGGNDRQYRKDMRRVRLGMSISEVRRIMGKPNSKQRFESEFGTDVTWYYGTWQLSFSNGKLESKNRYQEGHR